MPNRYFVPGGNGVWSSTGNWATVSGGTPPASVPTLNDDVFFYSSSPACLINAAASARSVDFTNGGASNYANVLTLSTGVASGLNLYGGMTFSPSMTVSGTGSFVYPISGTYPIRSNGININKIYFVGNGSTATALILTLLDQVRLNDITATYTTSNPSITFNGATMSILRSGTLNIFVRGTSTIELASPVGATVSYSGSAWPSFNTTNNISINSLGNVSFVSVLNYLTGTISHITSNSVTTSGHLLYTGANTTMNTNTILWNDVNILGVNPTINILSDFNINGLFQAVSNTNATINATGLSKVKTYGGININATNINAPIIMLGTASRTISNLLSLTNNTFEIAVTGGTTTFPSTMTIQGTQTIINSSSGATINTASTLISLASAAAPTFDTNTLTWGSLTSAQAGTNVVTLNSILNIAGAITWGAAGNLTFAGNFGWICGSLLSAGVNRTLTLKNGVTYLTTSSVNMQATAASKSTMTSDSATIRAVWTLLQGASQTLAFINGTRIDSSLGQTIWTYQGITNSTINWNREAQPQTTAWTYLF